MNEQEIVVEEWKTMPDGRVLKSFNGLTRFELHKLSLGDGVSVAGPTGKYIEYERIGDSEECNGVESD
jgi:hypothetical protein